MPESVDYIKFLKENSNVKELPVGTRVVISAEDVAGGRLETGPSASPMKWAPGAELDLTGWSNWCGRALVGKFRIVELKPDLCLIVLEKI